MCCALPADDAATIEPGRTGPGPARLDRQQRGRAGARQRSEPCQPGQPSGNEGRRERGPVPYGAERRYGRAWGEERQELAGVRVVSDDVVTALEGIKCDVVVANPPYLPDGAQIPQELNFEPTQALFGGPANGMSAPLAFIAAATRLLKPGGLFAIEHNELQGTLIATALAQDFESIALHRDLTDRPRFTTARRRF